MTLREIFECKLAEAADLKNKWAWSASYEVKNRSGDDGPASEDRHEDGIIDAASKEEALAKLRKIYPKYYEWRVRAATRHDQEMFEAEKAATKSKELTPAQEKELLADFEEWSSGFTPAEVEEWEVKKYIKYALSVHLPKAAATRFLMRLNDPHSLRSQN